MAFLFRDGRIVYFRDHLFARNVEAKLNRWGSSDWGTPSWRSNPFAVNRPLQLFHAGAWYLIAVGIGCLILGVTRTPKTWVWKIALSVGIGMLVGVHIAKPHQADRGGS